MDMNLYVKQHKKEHDGCVATEVYKYMKEHFPHIVCGHIISHIDHHECRELHFQIDICKKAFEYFNLLYVHTHTHTHTHVQSE